MARSRTHVPLDVFYDTTRVGQIRKSTSGAIDFTYANTWLASDQSFPVSHSLPLRPDAYAGDAVFAVFDNLLPDSGEIRRRLAEQSGAPGTDIYSLLSTIGRDCVGALQFLPEGHAPEGPDSIRGDRLTEKGIGLLLKSLKTTPLGVSGQDAEFRISIAGMQEKTALLNWDGQWIRPHGSTPTTHILKPQIGMRGDGIDLSHSVENEHFCMRLCAALGLPVANTSIEDFEGQRVLVIERFDRRKVRKKRVHRIPQEDCCQALSIPSARKYQADGGPGIVDLLSLFKASDSPQDDQAVLLKAQMVFWLLGATDGHAKNFSIFLYAGAGFRMTPLYDILSTQPLVDTKQLARKRFRLAMSAGDRSHYAVENIQPRHFTQSAKRAGVSEKVVASIVSDLVARVPKALEETVTTVREAHSAKIIEAITRGVERRLATLKRGNH